MSFETPALAYPLTLSSEILPIYFSGKFQPKAEAQISNLRQRGGIRFNVYKHNRADDVRQFMMINMKEVFFH